PDCCGGGGAKPGNEPAGSGTCADPVARLGSGTDADDLGGPSAAHGEDGWRCAGGTGGGGGAGAGTGGCCGGPCGTDALPRAGGTAARARTGWSGAPGAQGRAWSPSSGSGPAGFVSGEVIRLILLNAQSSPYPAPVARRLPVSGSKQPRPGRDRARPGRRHRRITGSAR